MNIQLSTEKLSFTLDKSSVRGVTSFISKHSFAFMVLGLIFLSFVLFNYYLNNGYGLAYNDARSHLNIGRRVVEGLKPGLAQLGSVWLPLPHILMVATIWNDFMWRSGLAGTIQSMVSYVITSALVYKILEKLNVNMLGRFIGVIVFATNLNVMYLQSTAMTELLLLATMTFGVYQLIAWHKDNSLFSLVKAAFWVMLSTLVRYDGWFLFAFTTGLVGLRAFITGSFKKAEGATVLFCTLGGLGIFLWLLWNMAIFKDPLFFAFGPYSAHAQQSQLEEAGVLETKHNITQSLSTYWYALAYNSNTFFVILAALGAFFLFTSKKVTGPVKLATSALLAPLFFNILALYLGHSVLFIQGINGDTWFNVRYGIMMMPSIAVFIGYLIHKLHYQLKLVVIMLMVLTSVFAFTNRDTVTLDDGRVGSSQKNVSEVSGWLKNNAKDKDGFILISAASHDAIIFSSELPMKKYIHEGTGRYWEDATTSPDRWARWIVMRTNDVNDSTYRLLSLTDWQEKYILVDSYPFADIYEIKPEFVPDLNTKPIFKQK